MSDMYEFRRLKQLSERLGVPDGTSLDKTIALLMTPDVHRFLENLEEHEWGQINFQGAYNLMLESIDDPLAQRKAMQMTQAWANRRLETSDEILIEPYNTSVIELINAIVNVNESSCQVKNLEAFTKVKIAPPNGGSLLFKAYFTVFANENSASFQPYRGLESTLSVNGDSNTPFYLRSQFIRGKPYAFNINIEGSLGPFDENYLSLSLGQFFRDVKTVMDKYIAEHYKPEEE